MLKAEQVWDILNDITDPEVPVLTIHDLGLVRAVSIISEDTVNITITPTYSGCPAMDVIGLQIRLQLLAAGFKNIHIEQQLQPAWTTDWMTAVGKDKLEAYGIAAPRFQSKDVSTALFDTDAVPCPKCKSEDTALVSGFSGTACKALYQCASCKEPFEYFKCH